jgi:O-antigen ligase
VRRTRSEVHFYRQALVVIDGSGLHGSGPHVTPRVLVAQFRCSKRRDGIVSTQMSASPHRPVASRLHRAAPARNTGPALTGSGQHSRALVILIISVVVMVILPELLQYLTVGHIPETVHFPPPRSPLSSVAIRTISAALLLVCAVIFLMRGHSNRNVSGATILLVGLVFPFIVSPTMPGTADIGRVALAVAVILAVWNIGAPVDGLKWVAISGSLIGAYSIIGALIAPEYMLYAKGSPITLIFGWQLAGPFVHSNFLGIYCALALALSPLIVSVRWRIFHQLILCAAILASASRICVIAAGVLALWWIICRFRSVISVRLAGTALVGSSAAAVLVLPFLSWKGDAFTGRGAIWTASLSAWKESPLVGWGVNWFKETAAKGTFWTNLGGFLPPHGHNLVVDTLVKSGLVGLCILALVLWAAIRSTRAIGVSSHQIACFGYLIAFLVISTTEVIWILSTMQLFPVVGLVFAVVILARRDVQATEPSTVTGVSGRQLYRAVPPVA